MVSAANGATFTKIADQKLFVRGLPGRPGGGVFNVNGKSEVETNDITMEAGFVRRAGHDRERRLHRRENGNDLPPDMFHG